MARNGSGTFSKVNTFTAGTPVTAASHNANWDDLVSEMTNSVAADGQTTMTGPLKASSGTVAAPGVTFASDTDSGLYRIGANNVGMAVNGAKVVDVATTGVSVTGNLEASGAVKQAGFALLPVGLGPLPWSRTAAPAGWVLTGQTLLRASYPALWAVAEAEIALGNTLYGAGNGSTTFTIASTGGRVLAGKESSATLLTSTYFGGNSTTLGATGGNESKTLATANLPPYTPSGTNSSTTSSLRYRYANAGSSGSQVVDALFDGNSGSGTPIDTLTTTAIFTGTAQGGTSTPLATVQPTIITNYIIFAGV